MLDMGFLTTSKEVRYSVMASAWHIPCLMSFSLLQYWSVWQQRETQELAYYHLALISQESFGIPVDPSFSIGLGASRISRLGECQDMAMGLWAGQHVPRDQGPRKTLWSTTKTTGAGGETRWNIQKPKVIFLLENSPFIYCSSPSSRTLYFLCCSLILYCSPHSSYRLLTEDQRIRYRRRAGREPSRRMRHVAVGRATGWRRMHVKVHTWNGSTYCVSRSSVVIDQDESRASAGQANASGERCRPALYLSRLPAAIDALWSPFLFAWLSIDSKIIGLAS